MIRKAGFSRLFRRLWALLEENVAPGAGVKLAAYLVEIIKIITMWKYFMPTNLPSSALHWGRRPFPGFTVDQQLLSGCWRGRILTSPVVF